MSETLEEAFIKEEVKKRLDGVTIGEAIVMHKEAKAIINKGNWRDFSVTIIYLFLLYLSYESDFGKILLIVAFFLIFYIYDTSTLTKEIKVARKIIIEIPHYISRLEYEITKSRKIDRDSYSGILNIKQYMEYDIARKIILEAGWQSPSIPPYGYANDHPKVISECAGDTELCNKYPEIDSCGSGYCRMQFSDAYERQLTIITYGELGNGAYIDSWKIKK